MSNFENANALAPASAKSPRTWDFVETTLVSLLAYGAFALTTGLVFVILILAQYGMNLTGEAELESSAMGGRWQGAALIFGSPAAIIVLWVAIRMAGREFSEYLALNWPSSGELVRAFAITAVILIGESYFRAFVGADNTSLVPYVNVQGPGGLLIL